MVISVYINCWKGDAMVKKRIGILLVLFFVFFVFAKTDIKGTYVEGNIYTVDKETFIFDNYTILIKYKNKIHTINNASKEEYLLCKDYVGKKAKVKLYRTNFCGKYIRTDITEVLEVLEN